MKLLFRYIFASHARLLLLTLTVSLGLYLLTEIVERADTFVEAGTGLGSMAQYYGARLPSITAQILPAVFLVASVITLCLMSRSREMTALQAGGVSPNSVAFALAFCGLFWGVAQLLCSQFLGVSGDRYADRIWQEEVRKREAETQKLNQVWFTEDNWIVSVQNLQQDGSGTGLTAYQLSPEGDSFLAIVRAQSVTARSDSWEATQVERVTPGNFSRESLPSLSLPIRQDPHVFFVSEQSKPQQLPLWSLGDAISKLRHAGSNVEGLITAWHSKLAYAASLVVMAILAAAIVSWKDNVYLAVLMAMVITFLSYALTVFGESMGQQELLPPLLAAWGPNLLLLFFATLRLKYIAVRR